MTQQTVTGSPALPTVLNLKVGGVCAVVGAVVFATARLNHGDTPAADAKAALEFMATRPGYPAVHVIAVLAALAAVAGLIALAGSFARASAVILGRVGLGSALVGLAVFGVESTSEGLALPELADQYAHAAPADQAELVATAHAVAAVTHGPSLVAMALLFGVPLLLLGLAIVLDTYPTWLGWVAVVIGALIFLAATGLYLSPTLIPGALLYGILASVVAQLWIAATGIVMLRKATAAR